MRAADDIGLGVRCEGEVEWECRRLYGKSEALVEQKYMHFLYGKKNANHQLRACFILTFLIHGPNFRVSVMTAHQVLFG
jgi:hypothetical protein